MPPGEVRCPNLSSPKSIHDLFSMSDLWRSTAAGRPCWLKSANRARQRAPTERANSLKAVRHAVEAGLAVNGEVRVISALLRPEVRLLVAERREAEGPVVVVSPAGPLTWDELQLVQRLGDPLTLGDLLPEKPVAIGGHWRIRDSGARALSEYDTITVNQLDAWLESADTAKARIRLTGQIEGSKQAHQAR